MTVADLPQRQQALDPERSFAVSAPAGSGKTELLIQRVLRLLALVDEPEEILCMTFTRKAAGEMQQRILDALGKASNNEQPKNSHQQITFDLAKQALQQNQNKNWMLLDNPNRIRIQTIDGFSLNLAQQLAIESRFGDYSEPLDDPIPVYREAIAELLLPTLEQQGKLGKSVASLLHHLDNDLNKLEQLLINLLGKREQWLGHLFQSRDARSYLENFLNQVIEETLSEAHQLLSAFGSDLSMLADYAANQLPDDKQHLAINSCLGITQLPATSCSDLKRWHGLCELLLTGSHDWRKQLNKNIGFPTETRMGDKAFAKAQKDAMVALISDLQSIPGLREALEDIRFLPPGQYNDKQWEILDALTQVLPALAAQLSLVFQQKQVCDFTEITLAALRSLGTEDEPTDLGLKLDYQIKHILTDEFQDTSSVQFTILRRLTAGWQPNDGRSLFIVGDAMQSLYGFRNANVGLFLEARSLPIGNIQLEPLDLQVNFRSQAGIINWVNHAFNTAFPISDNVSRGAVSYTPSLAHHPDLKNEAVTIDAFVNYPDRQGEANHVVRLVNAAKQQFPDGSIAILVRNRTHLPDILNALQDAGHRWQATDIDPLGKRMPVIDLMSLTRAMLSPADRIAWLAILRAPWCGLDLHDLFLVANTILPKLNPMANGERYPLLFLNILNFREISNLSAEGKQILDRVSKVLKQGWEQRYRKPLRTWIEGIWVMLGGVESLPSSTALQQCHQYLGLLEQHETNGTIADWRAFEKAVQSLYSKPDQNADPNLHVMTIHKAKGLEFDTVIIPGLNRKPRGDDKQLMLWQERVGLNGENQLIIGPLEQAGQEADPLFQYLQREQKLKGQLEKARVLYVGATRAINQLHLLYTKEEDKKPTSNSLLESLWSAINHQAVEICSHYYQPDQTNQENPATATVIPALNSLQRLPASWVSPQATNTSLDSAFDSIDLTNKNSNLVSPLETNPSSRHTGTVLHRILRQIVSEGLSSWNAEKIIQRRPFWDIQLRQLGVSQTGEALCILESAINKCLIDDKAKWLLDNRHSQSQCEYAVGFSAPNGESKIAIVDRTFVADGVLWIIDYKTAEPDEGEPLQSFLYRQTSLYKVQLDNYAEIFRQMSDTPIKKALYFPLISHLEII